MLVPYTVSSVVALSYSCRLLYTGSVWFALSVERVSASQWVQHTLGPVYRLPRTSPKQPIAYEQQHINNSIQKGSAKKVVQSAEHKAEIAQMGVALKPDYVILTPLWFFMLLSSFCRFCQLHFHQLIGGVGPLCGGSCAGTAQRKRRLYIV